LNAVNVRDFVVLGAGLTGLAAASGLGARAILLEKDKRPGGLVRTECFNGYWFDRVIHLLYFRDPQTESRIRDLMGAALKPLAPRAWVEIDGRVARFPLQTHLGHLDNPTAINCLRDFAAATFTGETTPKNFRDFLLSSFGQSLCDLFFLPYNRKMWKRPLETLAPSGFQWNIARPDLDQVLRGTLEPDADSSSYNDNGWYPRPPKDAPVRGMECLSRALEATIADLRLEHQVVSVDAEARQILARSQGTPYRFSYRHACLSSLPLPQIVQRCTQAPDELKREMRHLVRNRVWTVTLSVAGPRPEDTGHWRYFADESIVFNRLIFMHAFDPLSAPQNGWGMMAEITETAESPPPDPDTLQRKVLDDLDRCAILPPDCHIVDVHVLLVDPAYVVFTLGNQAIIEAGRNFLDSCDIVPLGRYGRWEYSSMAQVMRDGFQWAEKMAAMANDSPDTSDTAII
jgi:protoporphyrinogen oxidase